jgi:hypothetical protein
VSPHDAFGKDVGSEHPGDRELQVPGTLVYEYSPQVTAITEYGISADALLSGKASAPLEGARIDLYLEGPVTGPRFTGTLHGVDYLYFRADGRAQLHIHAHIVTEDGKAISLTAEGVAIPTPESSILQLRENVTLLSNHPEFSWVNAVQIWASGTVDVSSGQVRIKAYAV